MEKIKEYKVIFLIALVVLGFSFYWFQFRPAHIKKVCSWNEVRRPAVLGVTQEDINRHKQDFDNCVKKYPAKIGEPLKIQDRVIGIPDPTPDECSSMPRGYGETPRVSVPERMEFVRSTEKEYQFCLHANGL